jgi:FkbM family methyltransferase
MPNFSGISKQSLIGKLLRAPLRLIPRWAVIPILQGPLRGKKWRVGAGGDGFWLGSYEFYKQKALQREMKAGDVVYDIGSNAGFYTLLASVMVGDSGHVYSFEPAPDNVRELRKHMELNRIDNCTVLPVAVSSTDGEAFFDTTSSDRCIGRIVASGNLRVPMVALDGLIARKEIRPPNLMKIDIEGAELDFLHGASETIQTFRPVIFLATHGPEIHSGCIALLSEWKYRLTTWDGKPPESADELIAYPGG